MKKLFLSAITITGVLFASVIEVQAGPVPGKYKGTIKRTCSTAALANRSYENVIANATNPNDATAEFSTKVRCGGGVVNDSVIINLDVLDDGRVSTAVSGVFTPRPKGAARPVPVRFTFQARQPGTFASTSFSATYPSVRVNGQLANVSVSASSRGAKLTVRFKIKPISPVGVFGSGYEAIFEGNRVP